MKPWKCPKCSSMVRGKKCVCGTEDRRKGNTMVEQKVERRGVEQGPWNNIVIGRRS